jgi:hypothetical protein
MCCRWPTTAATLLFLTFLTAARRWLSVISVGEGNSYGHPHADVIRRLTPFGPIYRTDLNGAVCFYTDGQNHLRQTPAHRQRRCAGRGGFEHGRIVQEILFQFGFITCTKPPI